MLVISRKVGEAVDGGPLRVHVLRIRGNRVVLGFSAPPDMAIVRTELHKLDNAQRMTRREVKDAVDA